MIQLTIVFLFLACPSPVLSQGASKGAPTAGGAKTVTMEDLFQKSGKDEIIFLRESVMEERNKFLLQLHRGGGVTMELRRGSKVLQSLEGQWESNNELVTISVPKPSGEIENEITSASESYFLVPWSKRTYLVLKDDIYGFCRAVSQGIKQWRFSESAYFVKKSGRSSRLKGWPEVPKQYQDYLLKAPIEGKVIEDLGGFRYRINRGHKDGIRPKMELFGFVNRKDHDPFPTFTFLEVVEVKDATSIVEDYSSKITTELAGQGDSAVPPDVQKLLIVKLKVGSRVSTSDGMEKVIKDYGG